VISIILINANGWSWVWLSLAYSITTRFWDRPGSLMKIMWFHEDVVS